MKIIVLEIDALNLAYLGCYGNDWIATPNLDRLAWEGAVFDQHFAGILQADATGQPRCQYQQAIPPHSQEQKANGPDLLQTLRNNDIFIRELTLAFNQGMGGAELKACTELAAREKGLLWIHGPSLRPPWNLDEDMAGSYFDEEDPRQEGEVRENSEEELEDDEDEEAAEEQDEEYDEEVRVKSLPWLDPPEGPLTELEDMLRVQNTYAAAVTVLDAQIGRLVEALGSKGLLEQASLWITASSGLPLGEHGWLGFSDLNLHEATAHLPLLIRPPQSGLNGLRISALTQPADITATLLDYFGVLNYAASGHSLRPWLDGQIAPLRPFALSRWQPGVLAVAVRTAEWTLHRKMTEGEEKSNPQLFVRPDDRWEKNDVGGQYPEVVAELEKLLGSEPS
jgi:arylsulfatase A-like enzyme